METDKLHELIGKVEQYETNAAQCPKGLYETITTILQGKKTQAQAVLIGGEAILIKCKDEFGQKLALKIPRLEILTAQPTHSTAILKNLFKFRHVDEKINITAERFSEGAILQRDLRLEIDNAHVGYFNVPRVLKITTEPILYFVMEWIEAPLILRWLQQKQDIAYSLHVFKQLLKAGIFLHERGIVHRDFKSENILIGIDDSVTILDWTLAKILSDTRNLTMPGTPGGTLGYAPQKFIEDGDFKLASYIDDIYSLGFVFWEFITLEKAPKLSRNSYSKKGIFEYRKKLLSELPDAAQQIFWTATEQDESKRYPTCAHFLKAVAQIEDLFASEADFVPNETETPALILDDVVCIGCGACFGLNFCEYLKKFIRNNR